MIENIFQEHESTGIDWEDMALKTEQYGYAVTTYLNVNLVMAKNIYGDAPILVLPDQRFIFELENLRGMDLLTHSACSRLSKALKRETDEMEGASQKEQPEDTQDKVDTTEKGKAAFNEQVLRTFSAIRALGSLWALASKAEDEMDGLGFIENQVNEIENALLKGVGIHK